MTIFYNSPVITTCSLAFKALHDVTPLFLPFSPLLNWNVYICPKPRPSLCLGSRKFVFSISQVHKWRLFVLYDYPECHPYLTGFGTFNLMRIR